MKSKAAADKVKEREQKLKDLRRDLEEKLEEQLPRPFVDEKTRVEIEKVDPSQPLEPAQAKRVVEALLFASSKPLTVKEIRKVMKFLTPKQVEGLVEELRAEYDQSQRSFEVIDIAGGYEMVTRKEFAPWICRVELQKRTKQATQSALETLAILAYRQPLTRAEIEELRGVDASGVLANLMERGFVKIAGKKEIPGRPFLYATTEKFLEHFGLSSLKDLPNIEEIRRMVEQSVKREDLLGQPRIVEVSGPEAERPPDSGKQSSVNQNEPDKVEQHDKG